MGRTKKKYHDIYASMSVHDSFGIMYESMMDSKAWQKLTGSAAKLYVASRTHAKSKEGQQTLYNHGKKYGTTYESNDFVFPATQLEKKGFDRSNASKLFKELIEKGFIDKKEDNKAIKQVNVYSFSERWKTWNDTS